jgi:WD40 repeat protein
VGLHLRQDLLGVLEIASRAAVPAAIAIAPPIWKLLKNISLRVSICRLGMRKTMTRRIICASVLIASALTPLACKPGVEVAAKGERDKTTAQRNNPSADIGSPLFKPEPMQKLATSTAGIVDPVMVPAHLVVLEKADIPSERDGKILFIGTEAGPGGAADYQRVDPYTGAMKPYRKLGPGARIEKGHLVVHLDDQEALAEFRIHEANTKSAEQAVKAAEAILKAAMTLRDKHEVLYEKAQNVVSELELLKARLEVDRSQADFEEKKALRTKAEKEKEKAKVQLDKHHIRSPISGLLQPTNRKLGEGIRAQETLFQVQNIDVLRAEGTVPIGYRYLLREGMPVVIEPSVPNVQFKKLWPHNAPITGIALSNHPDPLVVTVSEDTYAKVMSWVTGDLIRSCKHDVAVRCVACTGIKASAHLCLTGADDGIGRIWDLDAKDAPPHVLDEFKHKGVISAVAFAPDGKTCATADSRDICLWEVASAKLKYQFPSHHLGEITTLTFTPQSKLVSASRDGSIAVWSLGEKGASLDLTLDGRSGDVAHVGVSHSGKFVLFDIGQSLRTIAIPERVTVGVMQSLTDAYKFASFAYYSPDDKLILTGTNAEGRLAVWKAPTAGERAAELRQFVPPEHVSFTCAAISPHPNQHFAVSGSKEGSVHFWPMPTEREMSEPIKGVITFVDPSTDATGQHIRVFAEFDNRREAPLAPGEPVTIVVDPRQVVEERKQQKR